jgi:uncharacterized protein
MWALDKGYSINSTMVCWIMLFVALFTPRSAQADVPSAGVSTEKVQFVSHGVKLFGTLVLPRSGQTHAAVVFIHGSGKQTRNLALGERFASEGIAALVYDKRGAGESGGVYESEQSVSEKNISLLADDAVSALNALTSHRALKGVPLGFAGISQAGWIAPLAAQRSKQSSFLLLWSAPVCKVSEEDIFSKYTRDANSGDNVPTYQVALDARTTKYIWPDFLGRDTDSAEDLSQLSMPGLWIFSDNDPSIPVDLSINKLKVLSTRGHAYDYVIFSGLGHNNMGQTFAAATDWVRRTVGRSKRNQQ